MNLLRNALLAASQNRWLRERATRYGFVRRAVSRFLPGERLEDALAAASELGQKRMGTVLTQLGENVADRAEAEGVASHYVEVLDRIRALGLNAEVSVKLTHLGLDLDPELCYANLQRIIARADRNSTVWVDMETSNYVALTLELYRRARRAYPNVGVCLQAYLYRTTADLVALIPLGSAIRLVKGAYLEPADRAFASKKRVDENYFALAQQLLGEKARQAGVRAAIATHDRRLIRRIIAWAESEHLAKERLEFQMLYGIQREEQLRLVSENYRMIVLISYGSYWFPWYMRRLAERPANVFFVLRNLLA